MGAVPNYSAWLENVWGWPDESDGCLPAIGSASNVVVGSNPPYNLQDFLAFYPKFGGKPLVISGTLTSGSASVSIASGGAANVAVGNPVSGAGIPDGTFVASVSATSITLTNQATATGSVQLTVWNAPYVPIVVLNAYVFLASASLIQARWLSQWQIAMALFIAHWATLYLKSDGGASQTVQQVAAALATGIQVSKSVGDVSVSYQPVQGIASWGAWNLTSYGQQLATLARLVGSGPMMLY